MTSPEAAPAPPALRSRATLHAEAANASLADRGIIEITVAHLIAAREARAPAVRLEASMEDAKNVLRGSIARFESFHDFFASMKLLGLLYALDPSLETLSFVLERLRAAEQWEMAQVVQRMLEERASGRS